MNINEETLPELPEWLQKLLPEPREPQRLLLTGDGELELVQPDGTSERFRNLKEAHEASHEKESELWIAPEVYERFSDAGGHFLSYPAEDNPSFSVLMMSYTEQDKLNDLKRGYKHFLEAAARYDEDPEDFVNSWRFVDRHPAFWIAPDLENDPLHWTQENHTNKLRLSVYRNEDHTEIELETGSHVPPKYDSHYGDWVLEVTAPTYELAIVELARRLRLSHNLDGTDNPERENLFEKPEWVKDLEQTLDEIDSE